MISTPFVAVPPPQYGGTELVVMQLVQGLCDRGHEVTTYATGDSHVPGTLRFRYTKAQWPPDPHLDLAHARFALEDILTRHKIDLIHAHIPSIAAFAPLLDLPTVYTIHHDRYEPLSELYRACEDQTLSFVAISERQRLLMGLDATVVHHGLDPEQYPLGDGSGQYAAFLGRLAECKGPHVAIDVARRAGVPLLVGGAQHAQDEAFFRKELEPNLQGPGVKWLGELSHEPKVRLLRGAAATVFPISWEEPFGLVMIESMLCGTPVLAFGRGSVPEVVDPGITGWICESDQEMVERLQELTVHPGRFDRAACRARACERFGRDRMVTDYLEVYQSLLAASRRRSLQALG